MPRLPLLVALVLAAGTAAAVPAEADDRAQIAYELLSVNSRERPANRWTLDAAVSRTGRYVAFTSSGTNLSGQDIEGDDDTAEDVYLRDRRKGTTTLVSRASDEHPARGAYDAAMSPNGRFLAFCSLDPGLVKPDSFDLIGWERDIDVFVRDLETGVTRRASTTWQGEEADDRSCAPRVADNGDTTFSSLATNLVKRKLPGQGFHSYLWDWSRKRLSYIGSNETGAPISGDARYVAFWEGRDRVPSDRNGASDVYLLDRRTGRLTVVSHLAGGGALRIGCDGPVDIDDDGRFLLAACRDGAMVDPAAPDAITHLFLVDLRRGHNTLVNRSTGTSGDTYVAGAALGDDGRTVAFASSAGGSYGGLPADDQAVYVWRRGHGLTNLTPGVDDTWSDGALDLSADGSLVIFTTDSRTISDQDPEDGTLQPQIDLFGVRMP